MGIRIACERRWIAAAETAQAVSRVIERTAFESPLYMARSFGERAQRERRLEQHDAGHDLRERIRLTERENRDTARGECRRHHGGDERTGSEMHTAPRPRDPSFEEGGHAPHPHHGMDRVRPLSDEAIGDDGAAERQEVDAIQLHGSAPARRRPR